MCVVEPSAKLRCITWHCPASDSNWSRFSWNWYYRRVHPRADGFATEPGGAHGYRWS